MSDASPSAPDQVANLSHLLEKNLSLRSAIATARRMQAQSNNKPEQLDNEKVDAVQSEGTDYAQEGAEDTDEDGATVIRVALTSPTHSNCSLPFSSPLVQSPEFHDHQADSSKDKGPSSASKLSDDKLSSFNHNHRRSDIMAPITETGTIPPHPATQAPVVQPTLGNLPAVQHHGASPGIPGQTIAAMTVPDVTSCGNFDGSESAGRWLSRLHWQFKRMGYQDSTLPPSEVVAAIDMLCTKDAATFLDSEARLTEVIERGSLGTATPDDMKLLEQALKDKYPVKPVDAEDLDDFARITQNEDEPLAQYYTRIRNSLRQAGGKDLPKTNGRHAEPTALLQSETTLLRTVISGFVDGLRDFKLRQEALGNRARSAKSLWQCYETVRDSQRVLDDKKKAEEEESTRAEVEAIRKALADKPGLTIGSAVAQFQQQQQHSLVPLETGPTLVPYTTPYNAYLASSPALAGVNSGNGNPTHQPVPGPSAPGSSTQPTSNGFRYPRRPDIICYNCNQPGHYSSTCTNPAAPGTRRYGASASLPAKETSKHPLVNGTETLAPGEKACFRCGSKLHIQTRCDAPPANWLAWWEQAHLKAMMFPAARFKDRGLSANEIQARSARLFYRQFQDDDEGDAHSSAEETEPLFSKVDPSIVMSSSATLQLDDNAADARDAESIMAGLEAQTAILASCLTQAAEPPSKKRKNEDATATPIATPVENEGKGKAKTRRPPRDKNAPLKPLTEIRGRKGKGPLDYVALLQKTEVQVPLMDLLQMSPDFSRNLKHLSVKATEKVAKTFRRYARMKAAHVASGSTTLCHAAKAYRVTPIIKYMKDGEPSQQVIRALSCQADQGSDVNLIHPKLVDALGLERLKLKSLGMRRGLLLNSSGKSDRISDFVVFVVSVQKISRPVWAIVQPDGATDESVLLILGLPWLWDVMATIDVRNSSLNIGDPATGETPVQIQGPVMSFSAKHKLALISSPRVVDSSEDDDDEDESSDGGLSTPSSDSDDADDADQDDADSEN